MIIVIYFLNMESGKQGDQSFEKKDLQLDNFFKRDIAEEEQNDQQDVRLSQLQSIEKERKSSDDVMNKSKISQVHQEEKQQDIRQFDNAHRNDDIELIHQLPAKVIAGTLFARLDKGKDPVAYLFANQKPNQGNWREALEDDEVVVQKNVGGKIKYNTITVAQLLGDRSAQISNDQSKSWWDSQGLLGKSYRFWAGVGTLGVVGISTIIGAASAGGKGKSQNTNSTDNGENNLQCQSGEVYNSTSGQCEQIQPQCQIGETYNSSTQSCESICSANQTYNSSTQLCENDPITCPNHQSPNQDNTACVTTEFSPILCQVSNFCDEYDIYNGDYEIIDGNAIGHTNMVILKLNKSDKDVCPVVIELNNSSGYFNDGSGNLNLAQIRSEVSSSSASSRCILAPITQFWPALIDGTVSNPVLSQPNTVTVVWGKQNYDKLLASGYTKLSNSAKASMLQFNLASLDAAEKAKITSGVDIYQHSSSAPVIFFERGTESLIRFLVVKEQEKSLTSEIYNTAKGFASWVYNGMPEDDKNNVSNNNAKAKFLEQGKAQNHSMAI